MSVRKSSSKGFAKIGWSLFGLVLSGSMVLLLVLLFGECSAGREVLKDYVATVKQGTDVTSAIAGDEAETLTDLLRTSSSIEVDNFQSQSGTSCFWVTIKRKGSKRKAVFVLADRESGKQVVAGSLTRGCECPDPDFGKRCHLR